MIVGTSMLYRLISGTWRLMPLDISGLKSRQNARPKCTMKRLFIAAAAIGAAFIALPATAQNWPGNEVWPGYTGGVNVNPPYQQPEIDNSGVYERADAVNAITTALTSCAYRNAPDGLIDHYINNGRQATLRTGVSNPCWQFYDSISSIDGPDAAMNIVKAIEGSAINQCLGSHPNALCGRGWNAGGLLPRKISDDVRSERTPTTWVAILLVYKAPYDSVNWHGPWSRGMTISGKNFYDSEDACKSDTEGWISRIHQGMKAPIRYRCVPFHQNLR